MKTKESILLLCFLVSSQVASGQPTQREFEHSVWDTIYTTANGTQVHAKLVFNGSSGHYDTRGGRGKLSSIEYRFDSGGAPGQDNTNYFVGIDGKWSFGGSTGKFQMSARSDLRPLELEGN